MKGRSEYVGLLDKAEGLGTEKHKKQEVCVSQTSPRVELVTKMKYMISSKFKAFLRKSVWYIHWQY